MSTSIPPSRVLYILAASHSGSTLLAMLLNSHPEICTVGELKITSLGDLSSYRCSCRTLIRECGFWNRVSSDPVLQRLGFDVANPGTHFASTASDYAGRLLKPLHRGPLLELVRDTALALSPTWRREYPRTQALNAALIRSVLRESGKSVIVDSSKIAVRLKYLLRNPALDVRVVRLIRDGRGVALTYVDPEGFADAKDPALRGGGSGASRVAERLSMEQAAFEWKRSNEEADAVSATLPAGHVIEVRYEDLCRDPQGQLERIFAHAGVDPKAPRPAFRDAVHHVIGNGMRLDSDSEVRLDERWRTVLSADDLRTFESVAGDYARRRGYA